MRVSERQQALSTCCVGDLHACCYLSASRLACSVPCAGAPGDGASGSEDSERDAGPRRRDGNLSSQVATWPGRAMPASEAGWLEVSLVMAVAISIHSKDRTKHPLLARRWGWAAGLPGGAHEETHRTRAFSWGASPGDCSSLLHRSVGQRGSRGLLLCPCVAVGAEPPREAACGSQMAA